MCLRLGLRLTGNSSNDVAIDCDHMTKMPEENRRPMLERGEKFDYQRRRALKVFSEPEKSKCVFGAFKHQMHERFKSTRNSTLIIYLVLGLMKVLAHLLFPSFHLPTLCVF